MELLTKIIDETFDKCKAQYQLLTNIGDSIGHILEQTNTIVSCTQAICRETKEIVPTDDLGFADTFVAQAQSIEDAYFTGVDQAEEQKAKQSKTIYESADDADTKKDRHDKLDEEHEKIINDLKDKREADLVPLIEKARDQIITSCTASVKSDFDAQYLNIHTDYIGKVKTYIDMINKGGIKNSILQEQQPQKGKKSQKGKQAKQASQGINLAALSGNAAALNAVAAVSYTNIVAQTETAINHVTKKAPKGGAYPWDKEKHLAKTKNEGSSA
jgi:hypothetical protein